MSYINYTKKYKRRKLKNMDNLKMFIQNKYIYVPFLLWFAIQIYKILYDLVKFKKINFRRITGAGGMPSAHSAVVTSLATLIGKYEGVNSSVFALSCIMAFIVMYDACGVRRAAGEQAKVLNKILETQKMKDIKPKEELIEQIGHTPIQVIVGAVIGIVVGLIS